MILCKELLKLTVQRCSIFKSGKSHKERIFMPIFNENIYRYLTVFNA
ncbi:hypothetical protein FHS57_004213 [Runella defluvii]|uniref:Uncharacterized protein n=1 Tax=Runella defluvii TaxID=370973 RepID=A0A7W5ZMS9_9BACT|nr:hypothetical protein [Runella defluvii]